MFSRPKMKFLPKRTTRSEHDRHIRAPHRLTRFRFGLYASVYTKNIDRALKFAKGLEAGTVGVNCTSPVTGIDMPFGGCTLYHRFPHCSGCTLTMETKSRQVIRVRTGGRTKLLVGQLFRDKDGAHQALIDFSGHLPLIRREVPEYGF